MLELRREWNRKGREGTGLRAPGRIVKASVVVQAQVGKEFPDVRQNEREIKFIRVGDAVRTAGQLKGEPTLNRGPYSTFISRYKEWDRGLVGHLLIGWGMYPG